MNPFTYYIKLFKRFPLVRILTWVVGIAFIFLITALIGKNVHKKPVISFISPAVGSPGDILVIEGENFGDLRDSAYVEIAGSRITSSGYLSWSSDKIRLVLPSNVQDGLLIVATDAGRSEPVFFANENGIPVAVRSDPQTTLPVIASITPDKAQVGETIIITGNNFGTARGTSKIFFTANREDAASSDNASQNSDVQFISANENDWDYELWSDTEIHVHVPDGADSGNIYVETERGQSALQKITVNFPMGKKNYSTRRTYVVQITADVSNNAPHQDASITLYMPRPPVSSIQPVADLNEYFPEPLIKDDPCNIIHQKPLSHIVNNKQRFSQNFVISVYSVDSNIKPSSIKRYTNTKSVLYSAYTTPDNCVLSGDSAVLALRDAILGGERNPYKAAKAFYDYIIDNYKITESIRSGKVSVLDLIRRKTGDAYDAAILYTALCRSAGIPALPVSGVLAESDSNTRNHWWTEIYFEGYGWFPVDVSLGAGLKWKPFSAGEALEKYEGDMRSFYFGNLDSQHIAFSRGYREIRPSLLNSKIVQRPRTYAMQSIWEEASDQTSSYSSLWNNPTITGIY